MRKTIRIESSPDMDWSALDRFDQFMYRRVADRDHAVLGVGSIAEPKAPQLLQDRKVSDWTFGSLPYAWRNDLLSPLTGPVRGTDTVQPKWFVPMYVIEWVKNDAYLHVRPEDAEQGVEWCRSFFQKGVLRASVPMPWAECMSKEEYLHRTSRLMDHIQRGDIYEVNFCSKRECYVPSFDPYSAFGRMLRGSDAPFASFYRNKEEYALCASPERFLHINLDHVMGQPMKGTRPRSDDPGKDRAWAAELAADPKERSENIMALDVMRNDLSRIAARGTVNVEDLCEVIAFRKVHQMISTVTAIIKEGRSALDAIHSCFPMASMTGAPKIRAMQLIDEMEDGPRGLFSGSLGFFAPDGTADFNVVIRTLLFNQGTGLCGIHTGSAITAQCNLEQEWEECQLKARSVMGALAHA